jgi:hypothetical protein
VWSSNSGNLKIGGLLSRPVWAKNKTLSPKDPISKRPRAKRTGGVTQKMGSLPHKHKALGSIPSAARKEKKKLITGIYQLPSPYATFSLSIHIHEHSG